MKYFNFKCLIFFLALAMAIPPAWAEEELLVCNGTTTNYYVPIAYAGAYGTSYPTQQMIYPADMLSDMSGTEIKGITFYTNSAIVMNQGSFDVKLGETSQSTYSSATAITGLTTVASAQVPVAGGTELVINFDSNYTYNGGNLVVEIYINSNLYPSYASQYFYGVSQDDYTSFGYGSCQKFLPKATFTYEGELQPYAAKITPASIDFGKITPNTSLTQELTIKNNGANAFTPSLSGLSAPFSTTYTPSELASGQTATIPIVFTPTTTGDFTATLAVTSTDGNIVTVNVPLSGTSVNEETIAEGTATSSYIPLYGYYYDNKQINQMIYPESMLTKIQGKNIKSMKFYGSNLNLQGGAYTVKVGTTDQNNFTSRVRITEGLTTVASVTDGTQSGTELTILFDNPFPYDGGNLLIDFEITTKGNNYPSNSFTGAYAAAASFSSYTNYSSSDLNDDGVYAGGDIQDFLPKVTIAFEDAIVPASIEMSPETLTINDTDAGTLTITGTNIEGNINASLANNTDWYLNPASFSNAGGTASVSYTGRALSASNIVTATAANDNTVTASATVNYVADLYIVTDNGMTDQWDFSNGTHMTNNDGTYVANFTADRDNTFILFARKLGDGVNWNTRLVFGPNSNGDWVMNGDNATGTIDLNEDDPIQFQTAGTYSITINSDGSFSINKVLPQVATPIFSPESGATFTETVDVTISCATDGATIYYTTDGTTPTTSSAQYTGAITVNATTTVKAIAVKSGLTDSEIAEATYTKQEPVATPTFSLVSGTYSSAQTVTITCATNGATIYYTTDGSVPTSSSTQYMGPIEVSESMQLRAIAIKDGMINSQVASATYIIESNGGELTIADGTDYVLIGPIYGGKFTSVGWVQMLYPDALLESMNGGTINTITFYPKDEYSKGKFDLYIGEIDGTDISSELELTLAATEVNVIRNSTDPLTINISPYVYHGGNLVLKTKVTNSYANNNAIGNNANHQWYGKDEGGTVTTSYSSASTYHQNWLPKTTFTYEGGATANPQGTVSPTDVDFATGVVGHTYTQTITITNTGGVPFTPVIDATNVTAPFSINYSATALANEGDQLAITVSYTPATASNADVASFVVTIGETGYIVNLTGQAVESQQGVAVAVSPEAGTIDFGRASWNDHETKQMSIFVTNTGSEPITPSLSAVSGAFTTDYQPAALAPGEQAVITITFTPQGLKADTAFVSLSFDDESIDDMAYTLIGTGYSPYDHKADFEAITYQWIDDETGETKESDLTEIATDPNQIIAMLRTVYMDKRVPGNKNRGYNVIGQREKWKVGYPAVGQMSSSGTYVDTYGWNIPPKSDTPLEITLGGTTYKYFDPTDYEPYEEGVTLIMVELKDGTNFAGNSDYYSFSSGDLYNKVKDAYKSARVITSYKRAGIGTEQEATLFKIDADKLNRFILLGKGKLRLQDHTNSGFAYDFCEPSLKGSTYTDNDYSAAIMAPFIHMFEEFSPNVASTASNAETDEYQKLINMESFFVIHDCPSASFIAGHHEVNMYGVESTSDDCQDVRDMMFTVPERRMTYFNNGVTDSRDGYQEKFVNYYKVGELDLRPKMGLYVIRQNEITGEKQADANVYDLNLSWKSNLLDFLPADEGQYFLYRVITDANGNKSYQPVVQMTESGDTIRDANGKPIPVTLDPNQTTYVDHVAMQETGQEVTYVVQGQDATQFLSLQMSNEESFIIPGTDETLKLTLKLTNDYSRFDPKTERNYYSNELQVTNNMSPYVSADDLAANNATFTIYRYYGEGENEVETPVATLTPVAGQMKLNITWANQRDNSTDAENYYSWINMPNKDAVAYSVTGNVVAFDNFRLFDNFYESVADNNHPSQYRYQVKFSYGDQTAYSNKVSVYIHKTDMDVQGYTQSNIDSVDLNHSLNATLRYIDEQVKYSSKQEILRYDAFRWKEGSENERKIMTNSTIDAATLEVTDTEVAPTGEADNGGNQYTLKMDGRTQGSVDINMDGNSTATFEDFIVNQEAGMYYYAPVVETFTGRGDYNTYGAPVQQTGVATIQAKVAEAIISTGSFKVGDEPRLYAHYNVTLDLSQLLIPSEDDPFKDYDLYKVRVWRQVDPNLLNEEVFTGNKVGRNRAERITGDFLMEEVDYNTFSRSAVDNEHQTSLYKLGSNTNLTKFHSNWTLSGSNEIMGTFGAVKLRTTIAEGDSVIDELPMHFIVRAYYTRTANIPEVNTSGAKLANRGVDVAEDQKYYIAEYEFTHTLTRENIITGIPSVVVDRNVSGVTYFNVMGQQSDKPFEGINIVVTHYSDGTTSTTKVLK